MADRTPLAFMSYTHSDDRHDEGRLTQLRERLSGEVGMQTGKDFPIFQDRKDIKWGQAWKERIEQSLIEVTFLIPIITPGFFTSDFCRDELQIFIEREKELKRSDLILPIYYVNTPLLHDENRRGSDELAQLIAARQYADWRDLRLQPFTLPLVGKTLEQLALQIRDALERVSADAEESSKTPPVKKPRARRSRTPKKPLDSAGQTSTKAKTAEGEAVTNVAEATPGPSAKSEPPTRVVDQLHRGDHVTISEAIEAANPGDRILARLGFYQEGLVIDKPLEIIGDGNIDEIVVEGQKENAISFKTTLGRVANLTLRQLAGDEESYCVDISQGRLDLEDCDITSQGLSCVAIHGGADPRLRRNRIHDGKQSGVHVYDKGQGTLEDNDIFGNALGEITIEAGGDPVLRRNRIHDGKEGGVFARNNGQGTLEDNDIFGNALAGIEIKEGSNPVLRRNRIHEGKQPGVYVHANGQGTLEDNDIFGNALAGIEIKEGGNPVLRRNRINRNDYYAVYVHDQGGGTFEDNDLSDNAKGPWNVSKDSEPNVNRSGNTE